MNDKTHAELLAPFEDSDIDWRIQWVADDKKTGTVVPYVTNRAIQNRLDDVVGFNNWRNEYTPWHSDGKRASQICGISIYFEDRKEWVTKYDGAEDSAIEPIKGGLSDSMKRAAVQWGLGRYLYKMDKVYAKLEGDGKRIASSETEKLNRSHQELIARVFNGQSSNTQKTQPEMKPPPAPKTAAPPTPHELKPKSASANKPESGVTVVEKAAFVPSVKGDGCMSLLLKNDNKVIDVFLRGRDDRLVAGTMLTGCTFNKIEKDGVLFITLEKYQVFSQADAA